MTAERTRRMRRERTSEGCNTQTLEQAPRAGGGGVAYSSGTKRKNGPNGPMDWIASKGDCRKTGRGKTDALEYSGPLRGLSDCTLRIACALCSLAARFDRFSELQGRLVEARCECSECSECLQSEGTASYLLSSTGFVGGDTRAVLGAGQEGIRMRSRTADRAPAEGTAQVCVTRGVRPGCAQMGTMGKLQDPER